MVCTVRIAVVGSKSGADPDSKTCTREQVHLYGAVFFQIGQHRFAVPLIESILSVRFRGSMPSVTPKILLALVAVQIVACSTMVAAEHQTIAVEDQSATESPLAISGTVSFWEAVNRDRPAWATAREDTLTYSHGKDITAKNISSQPIMAVVLSIKLSLPHGEGLAVSVQSDYFFKPDLLARGDTLSIVEPLGDGRSVIPLRSHETIEPHVVGRVLYAQLADGSSFGDEEHGKKILSLREGSWEALRRLDQIYRTQGPEQLMEALKQPLERHDTVHLVPEGLLSVANQSGSAGAEETIQRRLTAATSHQEMIKTR
jgi:hypothetical protein